MHVKINIPTLVEEGVDYKAVLKRKKNEKVKCNAVSRFGGGGKQPSNVLNL